ncbi:hypothetical protein DD238_008478 [Peronospora effusa]|uniref:Uncharacterized protein n=1 Tax=Peronospora effusa TaxID=542832 RepID=A0A3M6VP52_9STRA|nr:hypothetical protein DD238_008478 [Peronospora effusa]
MFQDSFHKPTSISSDVKQRGLNVAMKRSEAPESKRPLPTPSLVAQLQEVDRRMTFVDYDASQARDLAEAAESLAEEATSAIAGFAQRLERLEHSLLFNVVWAAPA